MARAQSQQEKRRIVTMFDQHGRPWTTGVEKETGDPCGVLVPRFAAPWFPDMPYIGLDPRDAGRLRIFYDRMEGDYREAWENWRRRIRDEARKLPGVDAQEAVEAPPQMLIDIVGPPPSSILLPRAAARGSRWLLGFTSVKPKWAIPLFPDLVENVDLVFEGDDADFGDPDFDDEAAEGDDDEPLHVTARDRRAGAETAVPGRTARNTRRRTRPEKARGAQRLEPVTVDGDEDDEGDLIGAGAMSGVRVGAESGTGDDDDDAGDGGED